MEYKDIDTNRIVAGLNQRKIFKNITRLAASIKANGQIEPIIVREVDGGMYEIVAGERRWRACKHAGIAKVHAVVRVMDDIEVRRLMLAENTSRDDLNPIEEAEAYHELRELGISADEIADIAGKSSGHVNSYLKLMNLSDDMKHLVAHGNLQVNRALIVSKLDHNRQRIIVRVHNQSPMTLAQFRSMANELQAEQSQDSLFSLADIWASKMALIQSQKATKRRGKGVVVNVPTTSSLPAIEFSNSNTDVIYKWIKALEENGDIAAAEAVGTLYRQLVHFNGIQLSKHHD